MTLPAPIKAALAVGPAPVVAGAIFSDDHVQLIAVITTALMVVVGTTVGIVIWIQKQGEQAREASFAFIEEVKNDLKTEMSELHKKLDDVRYNGCARACMTPTPRRHEEVG